MKELEIYYPKLCYFLESNIFKNEDYHDIYYDNNSFLLLCEESLIIKTIPIHYIQGHILGQYKDGSYASLATGNLNKWENIIKDYALRRRV